ncbi:hypothetical protein [Mesorhizobium japonicum]|uniref:hypothetical protein n=1 Tax=Mesorhizobium japonicum TaxID=2066070 RepID=UPI003B5B67DD
MSAYLGVPVRRFEDGKVNGQVDALIEIGDGYPLEVVSAHDAQELQLIIATHRHGGAVIEAGLSHNWFVRLRPNARMKELHRVIVGELPAPETALEVAGVDPPPSLARLGVRSLSASETIGNRGAIIFLFPTRTGSGLADSLGEWASRYLESQPDVAEKVGRHGGVQRHAFVWMGFNAYQPAEIQLSGHGFPPVEPPSLPPEITHLWVGSLLSGHQVWRWSPDAGWVGTGWETPLEP